MFFDQPGSRSVLLKSCAVNSHLDRNQYPMASPFTIDPPYIASAAVFSPYDSQYRADLPPSGSPRRRRQQIFYGSSPRCGHCSTSACKVRQTARYRAISWKSLGKPDFRPALNIIGFNTFSDGRRYLAWRVRPPWGQVKNEWRRIFIWPRRF